MPSAKPPRSTGKKILASVAILAAVGVFMSFGVFSSFSTTKTNTSNLTTATFGLTQLPDVGALLTDLSNLVPGDSITRCVKLTNSSSVGITVDATPSVSNNNLSASPTISLLEVSGIKTNGSDPTSDITNCVPSGASLSTVRTYLTDASGGGLTTQHLFSGSTGTATTWAANEVHYYQITVKLPTGLSTSLDTSKSVTPGITFAGSQLAGSAQ